MSGNQGLAMNCAAKIPVRVIRKQEHDSYVYDGLYQVTEWKRVASQDGPVVLKYKMVRLSTETGEPHSFARPHRPSCAPLGESSSLPLMCCSCGILGCCPLGNVGSGCCCRQAPCRSRSSFARPSSKASCLPGRACTATAATSSGPSSADGEHDRFRFDCSPVLRFHTDGAVLQRRGSSQFQSGHVGPSEGARSAVDGVHLQRFGDGAACAAGVFDVLRARRQRDQAARRRRAPTEGPEATNPQAARPSQA